ncbi:Pimeloyl-ACP methyl ester carboxylesterase [Janthinobacterium sp. OK676]|uniref:alpha/beta fold hydrolase n=1 Tax=unclassified Janthinobacterium TaxID=2610881 RepID=UPI0008925F4C|nr:MULTISPECIES: alpha/beta hydrolase [unclassified Janthinobacterium]PJJ21942.1 pimeloyl-ACP methyl ester carboxylesterase [Janthinobacterium sp. 67]SDN16005.1 Pimeloyl-ACP methyl ester carboxylesterase [Janthinobacterium sp. OK676]
MKRTLQTCILLAGVLLAGAGQAAAPTAFTAEVTGQGRPLILIPGLASSGEVWQGTVARLCGPQATRQCHVLTLAGFAGVPAIAGDLLAQAEQQLADYIVAKKLAQPAIIGHSLGGFVALKMAIDHPRQTGKLVIVDSLPALGAAQLPSSTPEQLQAMATQMQAAMRAQDAAGASASQRRTVSGMASAPADVERIIGWGQRSDRETVINAMGTLIASDLRQDVAKIKSPTLVLGTWIAYKDYAPRAAIEATFQQQYAQLPGVRIALADTARHFIMYDQPDWMVARIEQFLD